MAAEGDADIDAVSNEPCYDTNVLARTLSWLDHNNPHWPMQSYEAARTAYHHHQDCPPMTCATYIAARYKIRKSTEVENDSDFLHHRVNMQVTRTQSAVRRKHRPPLDHTRDQVSPHPEQPDVRLAVVIDGHRLEFARKAPQGKRSPAGTNVAQGSVDMPAGRVHTVKSRAGATIV